MIEILDQTLIIAREHPLADTEHINNDHDSPISYHNIYYISFAPWVVSYAETWPSWVVYINTTQLSA